MRSKFSNTRAGYKHRENSKGGQQMIYTLVGLSKVNEGVSGKQSKNPDKPYKMREGHFRGKSLDVEGEAVLKVTFDLFNTNLPELVMGATYAVSMSDKGFLRDIQPLQTPTPSKPSPAPATPPPAPKARA